MKLHTLKAILSDVKNHNYNFHLNRIKDNCHINNTVNNNQLQNNYFYQTNNEYFYVIKFKLENLESVRLIARLNIKEIKNILFLHEKTITIKVQEYIDDLLKYNILTSPLILSYQNSNNIDEYLKNKIKGPHYLEINSFSEIYKVWKVDNSQEIKTDGHHILKALRESNQKFFYAYLILNIYLILSNIFRVYERVNNTKINRFIDVLLKDYSSMYFIESYDYIYNLSSYPALIYNNRVFIFKSNGQLLKVFFREVI